MKSKNEPIESPEVTAQKLKLQLQQQHQREVNMELHREAEAKFIKNQETDVMQPPRMRVKKIRVDRSKRFMEDLGSGSGSDEVHSKFRSNNVIYSGKVRRFVQEMKIYG